MRYRFVDRILESDAHGAGTITAIKAFSRSEEYFDDTFRRQNEVPPSLVLEAMAAASSFLLTIKSRYRAHALLLKVNRAGFQRAVRVGDCLVVRSRVTGVQGDWAAPDAQADALPVAEARAQGFLGADPVADASFFFIGLSLARTFGSRWEEIVTSTLELLGHVDTRP